MSRYAAALDEKLDTLYRVADEIYDEAADHHRPITREESDTLQALVPDVEQLRRAVAEHKAFEITRERAGRELRTLRQQAQAQETADAAWSSVEQFGIERALPDAGHWIIEVGKAKRGDKTAAQLIERATAHQLIEHNPGLIPRPIIEPLIQLVDGRRPFIQSVTRRPLEAFAFDRPIITQHVAVDTQETEKTESVSQELHVGKLPVTSETIAGHLNLSRQDVRWSQPALMTVIAHDFALTFANRSNRRAAARFLDSLTETPHQPVAAWDGPAIQQLLFDLAAIAAATGDTAAVPDTFWMSLDVWAQLAGLIYETGKPVFPELRDGLRGPTPIAGFVAIVDPAFPAGTGILGRAELVEYYEDLDTLLIVDEPRVYGQLVGYAGYVALLNTAPDTFTVLDLPDTDLDLPEPATLAQTAPARP